jgi:hypothetical protein
MVACNRRFLPLNGTPLLSFEEGGRPSSINRPKVNICVRYEKQTAVSIFAQCRVTVLYLPKIGKTPAALRKGWGILVSAFALYGDKRRNPVNNVSLRGGRRNPQRTTYRGLRCSGKSAVTLPKLEKRPLNLEQSLCIRRQL